MFFQFKIGNNIFLALSLFSCIFFFVSGYFCGQSIVFAELAEQAEKDSFSDKIGYAVNTFFDEKEEKEGGREVLDVYEENVSGETPTFLGVPLGSL